ncbi:aminoacyl-tRNA hydrolase [bacterium]|nr:MAG: aminoacyl-tRNA hydrolase [bacterium]
MKIIFAQGNPGAEYEKTRHNIGFLAIDYYAAQNAATFQYKDKFKAAIAELIVSNEKVLLVKPTTFYNETGGSARAIIDFYKAETTDILALHDELALPFGTVRTRGKGSDAGNNGIKSLNAHIGQDYSRVRIGIANDISAKAAATNFVLARFSVEELNRLNDHLLPKISEIIDSFINESLDFTSHVIDSESSSAKA